MSQGSQRRYADESSSYDESSESSSDKRTTSTHSVVQGSISNPVRHRDAVEPRQHQEVSLRVNDTTSTNTEASLMSAGGQECAARKPGPEGKTPRC